MRLAFNLSASNLIAGMFALSLTACGDIATLPLAAGTGPNPTLPPPHKTLFPTIKVAKATGWTADTKPIAAKGLAVNAYARNLQHPRWIYQLPNGDILVAESNAPPATGQGFSLKGWIMGIFMKVAGAGVPSPERIILLRDSDGDGKADLQSVFLQELHSPIGMALIGDDFYVADADALLHFHYQSGQTQITEPASKLLDLPGQPINHHWTKNVIASPDGSKLYVAVGSNSNVGENGMQIEDKRASIWEVNPKTGTYRIFASGLRNPVGMAWQPQSGVLWAVVNERDEIGSDLVPDYMTAVRDGGFYGWPYSYYGQHVDTRIQPQKPELVSSAIVPDYALGPHTASLGLAWSGANTLPAQFSNGMFIGQHGSWNRKPPSGYKVIFVPFTGDKPTGDPVDVLTGFLSDRGEAQGRPVGIVVDKQGALLVADDVGNTIWRVTSSR